MIASECATGGDEERSVNGDEDAIESIVFLAHPHEDVLSGGKQKEGPEDRAMVATTGGRDGDEFTKAHEGDQAEENNRGDRTKQDACNEGRTHHPPGANPLIENANDERVNRGLRLRSKHSARNEGSSEQSQNDSEQGDRAVV